MVNSGECHIGRGGAVTRIHGDAVTVKDIGCFWYEDLRLAGTSDVPAPLKVGDFVEVVSGKWKVGKSGIITKIYEAAMGNGYATIGGLRASVYLKDLRLADIPEATVPSLDGFRVGDRVVVTCAWKRGQCGTVTKLHLSSGGTNSVEVELDRGTEAVNTFYTRNLARAGYSPEPAVKFKDGTRVRLTKDHQGKSAGRAGTVTGLASANGPSLWVRFDTGTRSEEAVPQDFLELETTLPLQTGNYVYIKAGMAVGKVARVVSLGKDYRTIRNGVNVCFRNNERSHYTYNAEDLVKISANDVRIIPGSVDWCPEARWLKIHKDEL